MQAHHNGFTKLINTNNLLNAPNSNWQIINLSLHLVSTIDLDDHLCNQHELMIFSLQTYNLIAYVLVNYPQHELRVTKRTAKFLYETWCKVLFDIYNIVFYINTFSSFRLFHKIPWGFENYMNTPWGFKLLSQNSFLLIFHKKFMILYIKKFCKWQS